MDQHPADRLTRDLIRGHRAAAPDAIEQIVERMATAPFEPRDLQVKVRHRGLRLHGRVLGAREPSLFYHLVQRVAIDGHWAARTTADQYLQDLRGAVRSPSARLGVFERRGARSLPRLLVVYAADRGIIVTGYQISAIEHTGVPETIRWLR